MRNQTFVLMMLGLLWLLGAWSPSITEAFVEKDKPEIAMPLNSQTAGIFVDSFLNENLEAYHVPGAAVVIVDRQGVLVAKGFGAADLETGRPVDPTDTLFRTGSVSKLFTATAVMQLAERGQIDLEVDINRYLKRLQVPNRFDRPVTAADLLLHTAGFDDVFFGMHAATIDDYRPLDQFMAAHFPAQTMPPGEIISYNDHGYTLAGLLIEDVSGLSYDEYVRQNILEPLGMGSSTFYQPLPTEFQQRLATGYRFDGQGYQSYPLDLVNVSPAAGLVSSVDDMSRFMLAHLNDGQSILRPETAAAMHQTQFAHHPELRGRSYGFSEWRENGRRAIFHDGGNPGFLNRLMLLPEEGVGFYLVFNSDQYTRAGRFHRAFTAAFFDQFYPEGNQPVETLQPFETAQPLNELSGYYRDVYAYSHDTLQKLSSLMNQAEVQAANERLNVFGREYLPVADRVFKSPTEESTIVFRQVDPQTTYLFVGSGAMVRVPWYESQPVVFALAGWFVVIFGSMVAAGLLWRGVMPGQRGLLALIGGLNLFFLVALAVVMLQMDPWAFIHGVPLPVILLLIVPLVTLLLSVVFGISLLISRPTGALISLANCYLVFVAVTLVIFPIFLNTWNLLGFRY